MKFRPIYALGLDYLLAQGLIKSVSMLSAILIVRWLSIGDYGFYTILLAGYTLLVVVSDLGLSGSMTYFMSSRAQPDFPGYFRAAAWWRRRFFWMTAVATAVVLWLATQELNYQNQDQPELILLVVVGGWCGVQWVSSSFVLRVQHRFRAAYWLELIGEVSKLCVVLLLVRTDPTVSNALTGIVIGVAISAACGYAAVYRFTRMQVPLTMEKARREVLQQVLPRAPSVAYFALSQIVLVPALAVAFAPQSVLAEVGALGRISAIVLVAGGFLSHVVTPLLVRTENERLFWQQGIRWLMGLLAVFTGLMAVCWLLPDTVLRLLGHRYAHLHAELLLAVAGAGITLLGSFLWELNRTRGLVRRQYWEVPVSVLALLVAGAWVQLSATAGLLVVILSGALGSFVFQFVMASRCIYRLRQL